MTVAATDPGSVLEVELDAQKVADINASLGGDWSVGLRADPLGGQVNFSWSGEPRTHQLVLEMTDEMTE